MNAPLVLASSRENPLRTAAEEAVHAVTELIEENRRLRLVIAALSVLQEAKEAR